MLTVHTHVLRTLGVSLLAVLFIVSESLAATCESLQALSLPNTTITLTQSVAAGAFSSPDPRPGRSAAADCRLHTTPGVLPGGRNTKAVHRLRHQDRGVDAAGQLERQVPWLWAMADWRALLRSRRGRRWN